MDEAFTRWLMTPDNPDLLVLADFLRRPKWQERAIMSRNGD